MALWARLVSTEISSVQYAILAVLDRDGAMSQRGLCDEIDLDRSTIADLVSRMERHGLIERHADPDDGRRKVVALTPRGRDERWRLRPLVDDVQHELTAPLSAEQASVLDSLLRQILDP